MSADQQAFWTVVTWALLSAFVALIVVGVGAIGWLLWREARYAAVRREIRREVDDTPADDRLSAARARLDAAARAEAHPAAVRDVSDGVARLGGRGSIH